jgi:CBS domain containing-hemolysin-like protein
VAAAVLFGRLIGVEATHTLTISLLSAAAFAVVFQMLVPQLIVGRDPERILAVLLPSFAPFARMVGPIVKGAQRALMVRRKAAPAYSDEAAQRAADAVEVIQKTAEPEGTHDGEERQLLRSIVDFGDTLVREVMTPRPDIVAIRDTATIADLRALFREQEYSRFPVFKDSLDNIVGFVFVKDLVTLSASDDARPIVQVLRPAVVAPESKRVPELLKQFQRQQTQIAIVVDEYGGTAGLVTIEDMLEEIVGEIRDEYDVESEPIVEEPDGSFVFSGKVDIDEVKQRLNVQIEREGFETVGGFLLTRLGRVPAVGERFDVDGLRVEILEVERRRIHKVRLTRLQPVEAVVASAEGASAETAKVSKSPAR